MEQKVEKQRRGFAAMSPEKQKEIASMGGKAAHRSGHARQFNSHDAREAAILRHQKANGKG